MLSSRLIGVAFVGLATCGGRRNEGYVIEKKEENRDPSGRTDRSGARLPCLKQSEEHGKPLVQIPSAKFIRSGGNIVGVEVQLHSWNASAYEVVTDLEPIKRLITGFSASINNAVSMTRLLIGDDGKITGVFDSSQNDEGEIRNPRVAVSALTSDGFAVYCKIGSSNYRIEFR